MAVYNASLPALNYLTSDERREIAEASRTQLLMEWARTDPPFEERVEKKAYDLYLERRRSRRPGLPLDDWLRDDYFIRREDAGEFGIPMK